MRFPKSQRLGQCTICASLAERRLQCQGSIEDDDIRAAIRFHLQYVTAERISYYKRTSLARSFPSTYLSLMIDFSEKVLLPHRVPFVKEWLRMAGRYSITVAVLINHTHKKFLYYYPTHRYEQGPNLVISILFHHFEHRFLHSQSPHPSICYFQADNKFAENKNVTLFGFCAMLLHKNIFAKIHLTYLPKGHTHEDGDQEISVWKEKLRGKSTFLPDDFVHLLQTAHDDVSERSETIEVTEVFDWKTFFLQCGNSIKYHSKYRCFRFFKEDGHILFQAKQGATDGFWTDPAECLAAFLEGFPQTVQPCELPDDVLRQTQQALAANVVPTQQTAVWKDILAHEAIPSWRDTFGPERLDALVLPPPRSIAENLLPQTQLRPMNVGRRLEAPRTDINFFQGMFVIVKPEEGQQSNDDNTFWLGRVDKACAMTL